MPATVQVPSFFERSKHSYVLSRTSAATVVISTTMTLLGTTDLKPREMPRVFSFQMIEQDSKLKALRPPEAPLSVSAATEVF